MTSKITTLGPKGQALTSLKSSPNGENIAKSGHTGIDTDFIGLVSSPKSKRGKTFLCVFFLQQVPRDSKILIFLHL